MAQNYIRFGTVIPIGITLPALASVGTYFYLSVGDIGTYQCTATNTWTLVDNVLPPISGTVVSKTVTGLANNVFTDVLTITIPNIATGAIIYCALRGSLGAGGAIGAFEATTGRSVVIATTRTPGLAADASIVTDQNAIDVRVAGATTIAQTTQLSAVTGAPTGPQTFTLQYRITRGGGASDNHITLVDAHTLGPDVTIT